MDNTQLSGADGTHKPSEQQQSPPQPHLPPGFRFHPTDEELVVQYLKRKVQSTPLPVSIIADVDLYKFDPWELPAKAVFGEQEWYFFSPRDRKYPNGTRPNRAATSGYWKATGTDKPVISSGNQKVGVKKALVFYGGKPPRGSKTNWIMHEYRLVDNKPNNKPPCYDHYNTTNKNGSLRLDDWVLCRIYKKNNNNRPMDHHEREDSMEDMSKMGPMSMCMSMSDMANNQHPLSKTVGSLNYTTLLDTQHSTSTIFDGILGALHGMDPTSSTRSLPLKRPLPPLFWPGNGGAGDNASVSGAIGSPTKRVSLLQQMSNDNSNSEESGVKSDNHPGNNGDINNITSISSLLIQFPASQTSPTVLDGVFRQPYPLPGLNWYS